MKTNPAPTPSRNTHFLVSGGGKGITAECAAALAAAYQCRFTLFGRSPLLEFEPAWAAGQNTDADLKESVLSKAQSDGIKLTPKELGAQVNEVLASREIKTTLDQIQQAGGTAEYFQGDIRDPESVKEVIAKTGQVHGFLHGAGALADKLITEKSEADFELVYGVKVDGLISILGNLPLEDLRYLILFSSVAGFYGNPGQADYSLSNEILNKYAHYLQQQHPQCRVLAVNWGPWDGGMVSPQLKRILERRNVQLISIQNGTETLVSLLNGSAPDTPQWVVGSSLPFPAVNVEKTASTYRVIRKLSLTENPFLEDHVIGGRAVLPTVCAVNWLVNTCEDLYPGYIFSAVEEYQVYKGIVFDESLADQYTLEITITDKSPQQVVCLGRIHSSTGNGKQRQHYQARIILRRTPLDAPPPAKVQLDPHNLIPGQDLYAQKILFHGPRFQGVEKVLNHSEAGLTTQCHLPAFPAAEMGQFPARTFHPYLADVHLQSLLIWSSLYQGNAGLPLKIAGGIQYRPLKFGMNSYVTMTVQSTGKHHLVADVTSHDREGRIYSQVQGAEITLSNRLKPLFEQNQLEREPV